MRKCSSCNKEKPIADFHKKKQFPLTINWCRPCREYYKNARYYHTNKKALYQKNKEYRKKMRETLRLKTRQHYQKLKKLVYEAYGNQCNCCGETINEFLTIDHINNDGNKHRREGKGIEAFYRLMIQLNYPKDKFQILCMNCNFGKSKLGTCPHKLKEV